MMKTPQNPYIAGKPLNKTQGFFGRQDIIDWVVRELEIPATNSIVLFGQRRIGKTSLLLQLKNRIPPELGIPVYFDLMDHANKRLGDTLANIADEITNTIGLPSINRREFDHSGIYFQKKFLPFIFSHIQGRLILLMDEFDVLDQSKSKDIQSNEVAKESFFPFLRKLIAEETQIAFVFVIGRGSEDLSLNILSTFKSSLTKEVWVLNRKDTEALIRQGEKSGQLIFQEDAVERIIQLTYGHPYLTQLLCQRIWQREFYESDSTLKIIDQTKVNYAVEEALDAGSAALSWLWAGLEPSEKLAASLIADLSDENKPVSQERLLHAFGRRDVKLVLKEMLIAPKQMIKKNLLRMEGDDEYYFSVELFRKWVQKNKPVSLVLDEIAEPMKNFLSSESLQISSPRTAYLENILENNNKIVLSGIDIGSTIPEFDLGNLYVPLFTNFQEKNQNFTSKSHSSNNRTSVVKFLNQHRFVVLLGDAGTGKSILINYLCSCFAGEILRIKPDLRVLLSASSSDNLTTDQWDHGALIPVKILLRDLVAWGLKTSKFDIWDYLIYAIDSMGIPNFVSELRKELKSYGGLIMFDGLDDVPQDEQIMSRVRHAIQEFYEDFSKCRILLTSRPYAYNSFFFNDAFTIAVTQFRKEQINKFVDKWYSQFALQTNLSFSEVQKRAEVLKNFIGQDEQIYELAQNPLILTLITTLYSTTGRLPNDRVSILSSIVDLLLDRWDSEKVVRDYRGEISLIQPGLDEYRKVGGRNIRRIIYELAFHAQTNQSEPFGVATIKRSEIVKQFSLDNSTLNIDYDVLIEYLINRSGMLVQRTLDTYTFPHRVFQEFLAASYLAETEYPEMAVSLVKQNPVYWGEIVVLTGGIASRGGSFAVLALINELCSKDPNNTSSTTNAWGAFFASRILMENLQMREPSTREKPIIERLKKWTRYISTANLLPDDQDNQVKKIVNWLANF